LGRLLQEDLVIKLENFGFTVNQAKIYLNIVESGKTQVGRIATTTHLHRQDIYKMLPKLEKMGLITKSIDKPIMIEAVPIENALDNLIMREREKANLRFSNLENNLKEMINSIQKQPEIKEETRFSLLSTDEAIRNKENLTLKQIKKECLLVTNIENIKTPSNHFRDFFHKIAGNKTKTRLIVVTKEDLDIAKESIERIAPCTGQFTAKLINKTPCKNYRIIDNKEIWIATQQKTENGSPCMLCTNDQNILGVYKENFKKTWNKARTMISIGATFLTFACFVFSFLEDFI